MFSNQTIVRYFIQLRSIEDFNVSAILASFYSSRSFLRGNVNWLRSDLSAIGLMLPILYLLCSPALMPHIYAGAGSLSVQIPSVFVKIIRQFAPMTKGHETYTTCGGTESFQEVMSYLKSLHTELQTVIDTQEVNLYGYQVTGLSTKACYFAQLERIQSVLTIYQSCKTPEHLVQELLVTLSALKGFQTDEFKFEILDNRIVVPVQDVHVGYGIRKYVRVGTRRVSFIGDPSQFHISLFSLLVQSTKVTLDQDTTIELNSPIIGASIVILNELNVGDWFLSVLNSDTDSAAHRDRVPKRQEQGPVLGARLPQARRGKGVNQTPEVGPPGQRGKGIHTMSARGQDNRSKLFKFDGTNWTFLGFIEGL